MAALLHRDDAVGIIAQRILGGDPKTTEIINSVIGAMWLDDSKANQPSIGGAIELFGWSIVREIAIAAILHQVHVELASGTGINPVDLDRQALAVVTGAVEFGASPFAALLANVGVAGLASIGGSRYMRVRHAVSSQCGDLPFSERGEFGFDHATLGAAMLWEADVPDGICQAVQCHSNVASPIWLAEELSAQIGLDGGLKQGDRKINSEVFLRFGVSEARLDRIKKSMAVAAGLPEFYFSLGPGALVA